MLTEHELKSRVGPILSDGTLFRDLIDLDKCEVSLRVLNDPEVHQLELARIFAKSWVVVGHELEIPNTGDYVLRYIGEDEVLVVRGELGEVNVLLNTCPHRGMEICRADHGNETQFMCPYHGWVFDTAGNLRGAPYEQFMYGDWDKATEGYGMLRAQVGIQSGIIFGNFDQNCESLDDYLGDFKYYLDFTLGDDPEDLMIMNVFGGMKSRMRANWKIMNDQFCGDHYHTAGIHRFSMADMWPDELNAVSGQLSPVSAALGTDKGHVFWRIAQSMKEAQELVDGAFMRVVFPAAGVGNGEVGGREGKFVNIAMFVPRGPTDCEMHGVSIMRKSKMASMFSGGDGVSDRPPPKRAMFGGPISPIGADDATQPPSIQRAVRGLVSRNFVTMKYPARNGAEDAPEGLFGPAGTWDPDRGYAYIGAQKDENQWNWWRHYFDVLTAED